MMDDIADRAHERCLVRHEKGAQCERERGHPLLHFATVSGVNYAWSAVLEPVELEDLGAPGNAK
jgi:hypothetical protein